jgi:hypothetical protein
MSGFLDSKERIMDTILTTEGKGQISVGKFRASYYSFSDAGAFYKLDTSLSGAVDAANRVYLEASSLPQDMITLQSDDAGKLFKFPGSTTKILNGQLLVQVTGSEQSGLTGIQYLPAMNDEFISQVTGVLGSSIDSFNKLYLLASPDIFDENVVGFNLNINSASFQLTDNAPIQTGKAQNANLDNVNSLFQDQRLSNIPNFQFMPPVNKPRPGEVSGSLLGNFVNINSQPILTYSDVKESVQESVNNGFSVDLNFIDTSKPNNLICQFFELSNGQVVKLDVIDFGLFNTNGNDVTVQDRLRAESDPRIRPDATKHVFFCGKVFTDSNNVNKFIRLFTLVFQN